ncbi:MAG: chemotaxis protein [Cytophagales bacterium]|nr:MAG: chemotaxis protein [Cytophagales bacterium]
MNIISKIKWISSIFLIFLIVLATNLIDKKNFNKLSYSIKTIYEDRIVASDILYEISKVIRIKEIAIISSKESFHKNEIYSNIEIDSLIKKYYQTKHTNKEYFIFKQLKDELASLKRIEQNYKSLEKEKSLLIINNIHKYIYQLFKIQLEESRRQVFISENATESINFFTKFEFIFLILMAILILVIIFYKSKETL